MLDSFRFAQLICWCLPATVAGMNWGLPVGLLTFGGQMFSAPPLTRMYAMWRAGQGEVTEEDVQRFNLLINLLCGVGFALLARTLVGEAAMG